MACKPHPTGGWRAYKKISGREYQYYSRNKKDAEKKQRELDSLAQLKPKRVFDTKGRLIGFKIKHHHRGGIDMNMQLKGVKKSKRLTVHPFETVWRWTLKHWKELNELTTADIAAYTIELKTAKRIYLNDLSKLLK